MNSKKIYNPPRYSWGGGIAIGGILGGYLGYKIGRARPQKFGFDTEKKIGQGIKKTFSKKKYAGGGGVDEININNNKIYNGAILFDGTNDNYEIEKEKIIDLLNQYSAKVVYPNAIKKTDYILYYKLDYSKNYKQLLKELSKIENKYKSVIDVVVFTEKYNGGRSIEKKDYFARGGGLKKHEQSYNLFGYRKSEQKEMQINKKPITTSEELREMYQSALNSGLYEYLDIKENRGRKNKDNRYSFSKGGGVGKFPIAIKRRIEEINELLPRVQDADEIAGGYFGSTHYSYVQLEKPIEIKNQYVYIHSKNGLYDYKFEKRYNVNKLDDEWAGRKQLSYDLSIILKAFKSVLKNSGSSYAKGGSTYSNGGRVKQGDFVKKKGSSIEWKVVEVENDWRSGKDFIKIYNDVTGQTKTLVDWSDYELVSTYSNGGGVHDFGIGDKVMYDTYRDGTREGEILREIDDKHFEIGSGFGVSMVHKDKIIGYAPKRMFGLFEQGGNIDDIVAG